MFMEPKITTNWSFAQVWNDSFENFEERPLNPRDYMYASELGYGYPDRFLRMKATRMTNPPNARSRRKFQAGNIWEWIIEFVLRRAGILRQQQVRSKVELPGCIPVSGRCDFVAGGAVDWERAEYEIKHMGLPEVIYHATEKIVGHLKARYEGRYLQETILESKAVSTYVMDMIESKKQPQFHNALQTFHYVFAGQYAGKIIYVCKDDCRLEEFDIVNEEGLMQVYKQDIQEFSAYWLAGEMPPLEPHVIFEEGHFRFNKNFKVEWSQYLTLLYGFKTPDAFRERYAPLVSRFNRVFNRCVNGDNLTKDNKAIIEEIKQAGFTAFDEYVERAKIAKAKGALVGAESVED
jgi:hypothetical protein